MRNTRYREPVDDSLDTWFKREILVHEASLLRYLGRVWPRQDEIHDLRQDIYIRIYESARKVRPSTPRAFMFATARNLMTDHLRRRRVVSIEAVGDPDALNVLVDEVSPERGLNAWQELKRVTRALNRLPPRCREVVWLRKIDDLSVKEVADQLGVSMRTVEGQIRKGMRLLSDTVFGNDSTSQSAAAECAEKETEHGEP
jgi:RNA polymerase sigma factor (sigma-70 family)